MSRVNGHANHGSASALHSDAPALKPNDALILVILARDPNQTQKRLEKLLPMLSSEGKLIAQALLGGDESKLPDTVVSTAQGLREWAKRVSPNGNGASHKDAVSLRANEDASDSPLLRVAQV